MSRLIGDRGDWKKIERNPKLIKRLNRGTTSDDKRKSRQEPEQPFVSTDILNLNGFVYIKPINLYLAKKRSLNKERWNSAIRQIYEEGVEVEKQRAEMPTPFEFMTGVIYILDNQNIPGLTSEERAEFLDDILALKNTYRGNHLNARFGDNVVETATLENGKLKWRSEQYGIGKQAESAPRGRPADCGRHRRLRPDGFGLGPYHKQRGRNEGAGDR